MGYRAPCVVEFCNTILARTAAAVPYRDTCHAANRCCGKEIQSQKLSIAVCGGIEILNEMVDFFPRRNMSKLTTRSDSWERLERVEPNAGYLDPLPRS
jgi:hypothetical protein